MNDEDSLAALEPRFREPAGYRFGSSHPDRHRVRYGVLQAEHERALAIFTGGLGQFPENDFENARSLADLGVTTFFLERFGEGGSERPYSGADRQKPAAVPVTDHARHLLELADHVAPERGKPLALIANCYGGLVGLHACRMNASRFDHAILSSPMLGLRWIGGREREWARRMSPETERSYVGKARDWDWSLAEKLMASDATSHDPARNNVQHLWYRRFPAYRLGGYTHGLVALTSLGVVQLFEDGELEKITTPITIVSAEDDVINDTARHAAAAARLPVAEHITIRGARHRIWREVDAYRDQWLAAVDAVVTGACAR